jgi:GWxTD domain-containing protein
VPRTALLFVALALFGSTPALAWKPAVSPPDTAAASFTFVPYEKVQKGPYRDALQRLDEDRPKEAIQMAEEAYRQTPSDARWWPLVAMAHLQRGKAEESLNLFRRYLETLPPVERSYYEDLRFVASREEAERYASLSPSARRAFLERFWMQRDPTLVTGGAARQAEHYRRVWFARAFFAKGAAPFDRRGEVYVRYGDPDWRARRGGPNTLPPPNVQEFRERLAQIFYGDIPRGEGITLNRNFEQFGTFIGPVFPIQSDLTKPMDSRNNFSSSVAGDYTFGFHRFKPVLAGFDVSAVKWETWVYTKLGNGVEIDFTDELRTGNYNYAPIPTLDKEDYQNPAFGTEIVNAMQTFLQYAPENIMKTETARTPERYDPVIRVSPLNFYYGLADFRGEGGTTAFELYTAVPFDQTGAPFGSDVEVECRTALLAPASGQAYRSAGTVSAPGDQWAKGGMLLDRARLNVPPGTYKLAVQARSLNGDRIQIYKQDITVKSYGRDTLQISDIQIAHAVAPTSEGGKFVKNGLRITPLPTAAIRPGDKIFFYFEVYNLAKDAGGQTRYRVEYTVNASGRSIAARVLSGLGKLVGASQQGPAASVVYEQSGVKDWEPHYVEMDLGPARSGEHIVRVTITDQVAGRTMFREAKFKVAE